MNKRDRERRDRALTQIERAVRTLDGLGYNHRWATELDAVERAAKQMRTNVLREDVER